MASKHKSASWFLKQRFFEGIKSFKEFEVRTGKLANTVEMGDALEILVEAYLHLDKVLSAKDVWVVGSIPLNIRKALNLPNDSKGIDGVYEDQAGNYIPYQVKYRTNMVTLPFGEISEFLGITEKSLQDRVIFTNARKLSVDVANRTGIRSVRADKFNELTEADFRNIHFWLNDKTFEPEKRHTPLKHQKEAIEKITEGLKQSDRTTAVMACGTGKTLVALWAAEAQDPKTVLVFVPSLALLSQTLPDWCEQNSWGDRFRYLCVCSDASVDREAQDDGYALRQEDLEFSVTTDPKVVKDFLGRNKPGVNVIFSTYQSAEVVAEGLKGQTVDLGIFDEAHKTTGDKEGLFAFGLSDKNIRIRKRLFLTATPRHYILNKRDKDGDFQTVSMSDESIYGKVAYRLSFSAAVAAGIIVPYKVIISVSINKEVDAELLRLGSTRVRRDEIQAKWVANQLALKRAIEKTGATKIITFHSRVNLAEDFAGDDARSFKEHVKGFDVFHVNGSQNSADRKALLEGFKAAPKALITNARCLTEGVDVPAVDMVAFIDPRKSKIDIAQAAGRAMRQSKATGKKLGYIVVPLFIEQKKGETEAEAFTRAGFDEVAEVLAAMLDSDEDLVDTIREIQEARGRGDIFNPRQLHDKIEVIGPAIKLEELTSSIDVQILERLGVSWDRYFGLLQKFHKREGHSRVHAHVILDGLRLGLWVSTQRENRLKLSPEKIRRLDSLEFSWDPLTERWEEAYEELQKFFRREGHCRVHGSLVVGGIKLGSWVKIQRVYRDKLSPDRVKRLNDLGFSWDPVAEQWEHAFSVLHKFHKTHGHCRVPAGLKVDGINLGTWVNGQRYNKSQLPPDRLTRLESLGFSWNPTDELWEAGFLALKSFSKREGHCRVPVQHMENGFNLGRWAATQRNKRAILNPERLKRLESLGFTWDVLTSKWQERFSLLLKFKKAHGHCNVPQNHIVSGIKLGWWVRVLRRNKNKTPKDKLRELESVGFEWEPINNKWEAGFQSLANFAKREGHCNAPGPHTENGFKLGTWVAKQRSARKTLTKDRKRRLDALGFTWDPFEEKWAKGYQALIQFKKREGHLNIDRGHIEGGLKLGIWMLGQRKEKNRLSDERIRKLNLAGFIWDPLDEKWEMWFSALSKYRKREGHCRVPLEHVESGMNLGTWVYNSRKKKSQTSPDRIKRLNSLGFIWNTAD